MCSMAVVRGPWVGGKLQASFQTIEFFKKTLRDREIHGANTASGWTEVLTVLWIKAHSSCIQIFFFFLKKAKVVELKEQIRSMTENRVKQQQVQPSLQVHVGPTWIYSDYMGTKWALWFCILLCTDGLNAALCPHTGNLHRDPHGLYIPADVNTPVSTLCSHTSAILPHWSTGWHRGTVKPKWTQWIQKERML